jgi:NADPH:quinone reductase-like Zn-dependent oxidoreductase
VVELGSGTNLYKAGDCIMAATDIGGGAYAEYIVLSEKDSSVKKPASVSHIEASGIMEGALTALPFLRDHANLKSGDSILINGASGSIGTAAVQLAKIMGANVTGVCSSVNTNMVKDLGADELIDYTKSDFTKANKKYDIIFDTVGKLDFSKCKSALNPGGKFLSPVLAFSVLKQVLLTKISGNKKVIFAATGLRKKEEIQKDLEYIAKLLDEGKIRSIIDRAYSLDQIKDAHEYVETGHKRGNVVIEM